MAFGSNDLFYTDLVRIKISKRIGNKTCRMSKQEQSANRAIYAVQPETGKGNGDARTSRRGHDKTGRAAFDYNRRNDNKVEDLAKKENCVD